MITLDIYKNDIQVNYIEDAETTLLNNLIAFVCRENINGSRISGNRTAKGDHIIKISFIPKDKYKYIFTISEAQK